LIWAELLEENLTVSFVEGKKKTQMVCIEAALHGSTREDAAKWVEDLLNAAYQGAASSSSLANSWAA
jgi:hypothetical protein